MSNIAIRTEVSGSLDALAAQAKEIALQQDSPFSKAFASAEIMRGIRDQLDQPGVMDAVMSLQGSAIGFRTDKDSSGGYSAKQIKDALIEATMRGLYPVGNEFNIISGRCYVTKEGFTRLLRELPGLANKTITLDPPTQAGTVKAHVSAIFKGNEIKQDLEFAVRSNAGMGADGVIGKAERKAMAWLHRHLTGTVFPEGDAQDLADLKNVTPVSPFEAKAEPAPETPFDGTDWSKASTEDIANEIAAIKASANLTDEQVEAWAQKRTSKPFAEAPVAMLRGICKRPDEWVAKVREVAP